MENWKEITNHRRCFVSDLGRVRIEKDDSVTIKIGSKNRDGYRVIFNLYVHRLVGEYFLEQPEGCNIINHKNGIKDDNRAVNLEWTTYVGNNKHAFESGIRKTVGERHWKAIPKEIVLTIYELKKQGKRLHEIAKLKAFKKVKYDTIKEIFSGKAWRYEYEKVFGEQYKATGPIKGAGCYNALPEATILTIYDLKKKGMNVSAIARQLSLKYGTVSAVYNGKNWKHLYDQHFK